MSQKKKYYTLDVLITGIIVDLFIKKLMVECDHQREVGDYVVVELIENHGSFSLKIQGVLVLI